MMRRSLRRFFAFLLIRLLVALALILPRRAGRTVFGALGALAYKLLRRSRQVALANLNLVYDGDLSDGGREAIARQAFINLGKFAYDAARMGKYTSRGMDEMVDVVGQEHMDRVFASGRGVVGLSGHIGNWELMGAYLALKGYPLSVLATRVRNRRLDHLLVRLRESTGMTVLERSRSLLGAFKCLKQGELLGVLIDQDTSVDSVMVDFLGYPAKTPVGAVKLASRTGAAVVPMAMLMTPDGRYRLEVRQPVEVGGSEDTLLSDVARCSRAVEAFIMSEPTQWVWMHKRWKSALKGIYG